MEIYVSNLDGSNARRLTRTSKGINISPRWNPQTGREIAFISDRAGTPQVYVMDSSVEPAPSDRQGGQADSPHGRLTGAMLRLPMAAPEAFRFSSPM